MPPSRLPRCNASPGNGKLGIIGSVRELGNEAVFSKVELGGETRFGDWIHCKSISEPSLGRERNLLSPERFDNCWDVSVFQKSGSNVPSKSLMGLSNRRDSSPFQKDLCFGMKSELSVDSTSLSGGYSLFRSREFSDSLRVADNSGATSHKPFLDNFRITDHPHRRVSQALTSNSDEIKAPNLSDE